MTDVLIKRELLERLETWVTDDCEALRELQAILAAPRQPEEDYGWLVSLDLPEVQCNCAWNPDSHDKTCPVYLRDRMADAQRAIAELREECEHLKACQENDMLHMTGLVAECERLRVFNKSLDEEASKRLQDVTEAENEAYTLRQQLAERDAQIASMRAEVTPFIETHWMPVARQRDKLADLLQEVVSEYVHGTMAGMSALVARIDATLDEVK